MQQSSQVSGASGTLCGSVRRATPRGGWSAVARRAGAGLVLAMALAGGIVQLGGCAGGGGGEVVSTPLTPDERAKQVASFDEIWTTVNEQHWDPNLGGVDWEGAKRELRPRVEAAATLEEARAAMEALIERLGLSHFGLVPGEAVSAMREAQRSAGREDDGSAKSTDGESGLTLRVIGGDVLAVSVREGSPAARAGVAPGWSLVRVGEADVPALLAKLQAASGTHSDSHESSSGMGAIGLNRRVSSLIDGPAGRPLRLRWLDLSNRTRETSFELAPSDARMVSMVASLPDMPLRLESKTLPSGVGYIALSLFADPAFVMGEFGRAMRTFREAPGVIIDLRGNPGGIGAMAMGMGGWFVSDESKRLGVMRTREGELKFFLNPRGGKAFAGRVAVLVDEMSASTSEIFAGGMQDLGLARVFGTRSAGAALPSTFKTLANGDQLQFAFATYTSTGGRVLEGNGVVPDQVVVPTRQNLRSGRDPVVAAAEAWVLAGAGGAGSATGAATGLGTWR
jgi:carboxyl-terminal processing protease